MRVVVRRAAAAAAACAAGAGLALGAGLLSPAHADTHVVPGGSRLDAQTFLTYVPCAGFFAPGATAPQLLINRGPATPPLGRRSFGLALPGSGTAAGVVHQTLSMGGLGEVSMAVNPEQATTGVAYAWYVSPDLPAGQAWLGRAELAAAPGWQRVDVSAASFTWQAHDLATRQPQGDPARAVPADFVAAHGDGPGYVVAGLGCDGASYNLDAVRYGGTTFDLEGFRATTHIAAEPGAAGEPTVLTGWSTRDDVRLGDPLVLERQVAGTSRWEAVGEPVLADAGATVRTTVAPDVATTYRWRMADSEYADENTSDPVRVDAVRADAQPAAEDPTAAPPADRSADPAAREDARSKEPGGR